MLKIDKVCAFYDTAQALFDISAEVNQGEIVTIVGSNGAGKTTTLKTISGVIKAARGTVTYKGQEIQTWAPSKIVRAGIAHCPEGRQLWPDMTVLENLEIGAYTRTDKDEVKRDMEWMMNRFPIIRQRKSQLAQSLSGGEQQSLAVARALMAKPDLIMFDEPSLGLSPKLAQETLRIIQELRAEKNITVILVEQNAFAALKIADRGYVLEKGRVILEDKADKLLKDPYVKKAYLGL